MNRREFAAALAAIPGVAEVESLQIKPGMVVVFRVNETHIAPERIKHITQAWEKMIREWNLPKVPVMVLTGDMDMITAAFPTE